ncbi:MAG: hypothetical protein LAQ69_41985 [Acidobacteriia bacterium]|nr:hypothetical protein [Terriglobia bacterium]
MKYADPQVKLTKQRDQRAREMLWEWARKHKTVMVLNGINSGELRTIISSFSNPDNPYPWCEFEEDAFSLDCALTAVGIVLPEKVYSRPRRQPGQEHHDFQREWKKGSFAMNPTPYHFELVQLLEKYKLAV